MLGTDSTALIWAIAGIIGLFFLARAILLWYWRVNEIIEELKKTNELLSKLVPKEEKTVTDGKD